MYFGKIQCNHQFLRSQAVSVGCVMTLNICKSSYFFKMRQQKSTRNKICICLFQTQVCEYSKTHWYRGKTRPAKSVFSKSNLFITNQCKQRALSWWWPWDSRCLQGGSLWAGSSQVLAPHPLAHHVLGQSWDLSMSNFKHLKNNSYECACTNLCQRKVREGSFFQELSILSLLFLPQFLGLTSYHPSLWTQSLKVLQYCMQGMLGMLPVPAGQENIPEWCELLERIVAYCSAQAQLQNRGVGLGDWDSLA